MCNSRLFILFIGASFIVSGIFAQQPFTYSFRHITQADGLLHNEVLSIAQDGKGFIWIATPNGLQRYDGSRFIYYPDMLSNPAGGNISGANLYADKKNNLLWIINNTNLEKMELTNKKIQPYDNENILKDTSFTFTRYQGENNIEWMLGNQVVYQSGTTANKITQPRLFFFPAGSQQASFITTDGTGDNTWLATGSQLLWFVSQNKTVYSSTFNPAQHPLLQSLSKGTWAKSLRLVMIDGQKNIWVSTWGNVLYRYDEKTKKVSQYTLSSPNITASNNKTPAALPLVNCMLEDGNHTIWIGTENAGLLRYNPAKDNFDYSIAEESNKKSIRYDYKIFSLFQDKEQNIWIGTDKGISVFNPYRQYFTSVRHEENNPLSIPKSEIISFIQTAGGDSYIGTWGGGIAVYDKYLNFKKNIFFNGPDDKNKVWSFQQVDDETLWAGCQQGYLLVYTIATGVTKTILPPEIGSSTIRCMKEDSKGNILFGLNNGKIAKWDKQKQKFFPFRDSLTTSCPVLNIFIDREQRCWVSTEKGGFKEFDAEKMVYADTWLPDENKATSIAGITCYGIEEYNDSVLLIGTSHGGLNFFNKKTRTFSYLATAEGQTFNTIYAIKKDPANYIWFTTDYGVYKFNPVNKKIISYNIEPGLINSSLISPRFYLLQNGQWLTFSTTEAISFFPHKAEYKDNLRPKIEITGLTIFDKPVFIDSVLDTGLPLQLSYKENFFKIEFASLNFSTLQQTNYYYRLKGIDKNWVNSGTTRFANYTNLSPGKYIFDVKAENGNSTGEITSLEIIIAPPWWKTAWFITLVSSCILLLTYVLIKWRIKSIKTIAAEKLKVQQLHAEQYKGKLEMEQISNYFSSSLINKNKVEDVLWDVAKNLIGRLGFVDCMIYLWNDDKTKMIQKAGFGPKGSVEEITKQHFDVLPGQGVVGYVMQTKEPVLIPDTSKDCRYRPDEMARLSEMTVPIIYNNELLGIIDSENPEKNFYTTRHLQLLTTISTLVANKIKSLEAEQSLRQSDIEMYSMNEQLSKAKVEALHSQMNPHFIFNCLTSIDNLIQTNEKEKATDYLAKFARLIRAILENSKNNTIPCWKDLETLELYLEMEKLRWDNKITCTLTIDNNLMEGDYRVPPMVVQPYIENAIQHGLLNKMGPDKKLDIEVYLEENNIKYTITDNGVGRQKAGVYKKINKPSQVSFGMQISKDRIDLFNQGQNSQVKITDLYNLQHLPEGTKVEVWLTTQPLSA